MSCSRRYHRRDCLCQLHTMNGQLNQMVSSGQQTDSLICLYRKQLEQLTKQTGDTHDLAVSAGAQATQALAQAKATRDLARTSNDALVSVQRAFVFPSVTFTPIYKAGKTALESLEINPVWGNSGDTPTRGFTMHASELYSIAELPKSFDFPDLWDVGDEQVPTPAVIGPKSAVGGHAIFVPLAMEEILADKRQHLYLWGWARYNDVFPKTQSHITKYCWDVNIRRVSSENGNETFLSNTNACRRNNCYDDECKVE